MTIQDLGSLGELLAAIATIATLIYLARQIHQNTNQLMGEAIIEINSAERQLVDQLRADESLVNAFVNALNDWSSVSIQDQARVHLYLHPYARWCETCWMLWKRGALDETTYESRKAMTVLILKPSGAREWWNHVKMVYDPRFVAAIDQALNELPSDAISIIDIPFYAPSMWKYGSPPNKAMEPDT